MTYITVPGNVDNSVKMRLWDAKSRNLISNEIYALVMNIDKMDAFDLITLVSKKIQSTIGGITKDKDG